MIFASLDRLHRKRWLCFVACAVLIGAWFLYFAGDGLWASFSGDDLMNLHLYLQKPWSTLFLDNLRYWSTAYRPLGGLFYAGLYTVFGFDPLPFRIVCFLLLFVNLALRFVFLRLVSRSNAVAAMGTFLLSYHAWFVDLHQSSGTIYELLCFACYFSAFNFYISIRQKGRVPSWRQCSVLAVLYVCALNSKEMAVTLPVFLLIYEALSHGLLKAPLSKWPFYGGRVTVITGLLTIPYVIGKLTGSGTLVENPAYQLSISPGRYLDTFQLYLNPFLYQHNIFRDPNTIQMLLAMLAFAAWRRSRPMILAWLFLLLSLLPVAFVNHYSAFFM